MPDIDVIQRAYDLARTGRYAGPSDIRRKLKQEHYFDVEQHLSGPSIVRTLRGLCSEARRLEVATGDGPDQAAVTGPNKQEAGAA